MTNYTEAELKEIRLIDQMVRDSLRRLGLPILNDKPIEAIIASGELKAAECYVQSKDLVTPGWLERASSGAGDQS